MNTKDLRQKCVDLGFEKLHQALWQMCCVKHVSGDPKKSKSMYKKLMTGILKEYESEGKERVVLPCVKIIEAFKIVNPMVGRLYAMKTQRSAADRLLEQFGEEELLKMIASLPAINAMPFAPKATTPMELEIKCGQIIAFVAQEKNRNGGNKQIGVAF